MGELAVSLTIAVHEDAELEFTIPGVQATVVDVASPFMALTVRTELVLLLVPDVALIN